MEHITGTIERVTFHNAENGFVVLRAEVSGKRGPVVVVGQTPRAIAGEFFNADCVWQDDPEHRLQFKATTLQTTPSSLYLRLHYQAEAGVAERLTALLSGTHPLEGVAADKALAWVEEKMALTLADRQRDAIARALTQKVLVITGEPGTGKSTLMRGILDIFEAKRLRCAEQVENRTDACALRMGYAALLRRRLAGGAVVACAGCACGALGVRSG